MRKPRALRPGDRIAVVAPASAFARDQFDAGLAEIRTLVARLDIPVKQVLIESRIVIANNDYSRELGTRFGVSAVARNGSNGLISTSGSAEANDTTVNSFISNGNGRASVGNLEDRFNVSLPAGGNAGRIALAVLGSDYLVDLELSALQAEGLAQFSVKRQSTLQQVTIVGPDNVGGRGVLHEREHGLPQLTAAVISLQQTAESLDRLARGEYGWCRETGEAIGLKRLLEDAARVLAQGADERSRARALQAPDRRLELRELAPELRLPRAGLAVVLAAAPVVGVPPRTR